jgi:hypothetical protein
MVLRLIAGLAVLGLATMAAAIPAVDVALFFDPVYVDTSAPPDGEATNLQASLTSLGDNVTTFVGTSASAIDAAVAGKSVLAFPELEKQDLSPDLDVNAHLAISLFVGQGGTLLMVAPGSGDPLAVVNESFNSAFQMTATTVTGPITLNAAAANGTAFAGGPATLAVNNATTAVLASSLPPSARIIYADANGNSVVTLLPPDPSSTGNGNIVILGWDWFDAAPTGSQDGGWLAVLSRASRVQAGTSIPTLSEWAMIIMAAFLAFAGATHLRRVAG